MSISATDRASAAIGSLHVHEKAATMIAVDSVRTEGGAQPRLDLDWMGIGDYQELYEETAGVLEELVSLLPAILPSGDQAAIVQVCSLVAECRALIGQINADLPPPDVLDRIEVEGGLE